MVAASFDAEGLFKAAEAYEYHQTPTENFYPTYLIATRRKLPEERTEDAIRFFLAPGKPCASKAVVRNLGERLLHGSISNRNIISRLSRMHLAGMTPTTSASFSTWPRAFATVVFLLRCSGSSCTSCCLTLFYCGTRKRSGVLRTLILQASSRISDSAGG